MLRLDELGYQRVWFAEHHGTELPASEVPAVLPARVSVARHEPPTTADLGYRVHTRGSGLTAHVVDEVLELSPHLSASLIEEVQRRPDQVVPTTRARAMPRSALP
ncbi:hypothetical protein ACWEFL_20280 [Streptomyces sp. NPDC004838]